MAKENKLDIPIATGNKTAKAATQISQPLYDIERAFDRVFGRGWPSLTHWPSAPMLSGLFEMPAPRLPSLDVIDRDTEVLVRAEVPGVDKKDLDISITDNLLTIKGHSASEKKEEKGDYHRQEISRSSFARSVVLPGSVDSSKAAASLKDGILEITLPKVEASKRRNIAVE